MIPRQAVFSEADLLSAGADLCFIYTLHASDDPECRPRYVGFTCDPIERERRHNQRRKNGGRRALWIHGLKDKGARVVLTVIHKFRSSDLTECSIVEASWIECYRKKFPDLLNDAGGGEGIARPSESLRKKISQIVKQHFSNPQKRKEMSEKIKAFFSDPAQRRKMSERQKRLFSNPEMRAKMGAAQKRVWQNPEVREKQSRVRKEVWERPAYKAKRIAETKELWKDPAYRARRKQASAVTHATSEFREKMKNAAKGAWQNPEYRAKRAATFARKKLQKLNEF